MRSRDYRTKNLFESRNTIDFNPENPENREAVFISYKRKSDRDMAQTCAAILKDTPGLYYWIDEEHAEAKDSDIEIARCIEEGLDATSALLGIIGTDTLKSAWIPYEIGGARGRQRFNERFDKERLLEEEAHPLIAHLIYEPSITELPGFIKLGTPLRCLCEVQQWAAYIAEILRKESVPLYEVRSIRKQHGIQDIYKKNVQFFTEIKYS